MKLILLTSFILISTSLTSIGQNIYLSNGIIENGKYKDNNNHLINIENYSGFNKVIFSSNSATIQNPFLVVSKKSDSLFIPIKWSKFDKKSSGFDYDSDIIWDNDGDYKLSVIDGQRELISDYYTVNVNEDDEFSNSNSYDDNQKYNDPNNTFYYIDSNVEFCESLSEKNEPVNISSEFPTGKVTIYVSNTKPIITTELKVSIYKLKGKSNQDLIEEKYFLINSGDMNVSFNYYFGTKGSFLVSVYANEDVWVNDGNIKIK